MRTDLFIKSFRADAAIAPHRIVRAGAADASIAQASAAANPILGVHGSLAAATGDVTDCVVGGYASVEYGGNVTRGAPLTADASGRAIVATTTGQRIVGFAILAGAVGDIGTVAISLGSHAASA